MIALTNYRKTVALMALAWCVGAAAQSVTYPFPDATQLISEEPAGEAGWYSKSCTKYMKLVGPLEYGGESCVPSKIVEDENGNVYIGNMFTDFAGAGWLKGSRGSDGSMRIEFPQIMFDEEYSEDCHYYYYACCMRLNEEMTDLEMNAEQVITLLPDGGGGFKMEDPDVAIGICYVYNPVTEEQPQATGEEGCELRWFGIAYNDLQWASVDTSTVEIPDGIETQQFALCHSTGARFVDVAIDGDRILIPGLSEDPESCIVGNISSDGRTVNFPTDQFMGVFESETGEYFCYMVAVGPEDIFYPETGETVHTIAAADYFIALWDGDKKTLTFIDGETGFSICNEQSGIGDGVIYLEPALVQQDDYIAASPASPQIVAYNPYNEEQNYGTLNFNLPSWTPDGLLVNPECMFYNIYLDDDVMTLTPGVYQSLETEMSDIPYGFTDYYDIFSVGINHAIYLYSGGYERIGVQSYVEADGARYYSPVVYVSNSSVNMMEDAVRNIVETYYIDLSGARISEPQSGFAIKCIRYDDGSIETEKIIVR